MFNIWTFQMRSTIAWPMNRCNFTASTLLSTLYRPIVIVFIVLLCVVRLKSRIESDTRSNDSVYIDFNEMMVTHLPIFICVVRSSEIKTDVVDDDNDNRLDASKNQHSTVSRARTSTPFKVLYLVQVFPFGVEINDALRCTGANSLIVLLCSDSMVTHTLWWLTGGRCELIRNVLVAICL